MFLNIFVNIFAQRLLISYTMLSLSVIITSYNGEKTILNTIESILNQEGRNELFALEMIVVDDCSTDKTRELLNAYDVKILSTPFNSGGPNMGRNIGIKAASGDFIAITDHDDIWVAQKVKQMLPYFDRVPIVTSGYTIINLGTKQEIRRVANEKKAYIHFLKNETFLNRLSKKNSGQNTYLGAIIYKRELNHILFEEYFGVVDYDWILRLFHQQESIEVSQSLYNRYVHGANLFLKDSYRKIDFYYSLMTIEDYQPDYPKQVKRSYKRINGSRARYYYLIGNMRKARYHFRKAEKSLVNLLYILSSYVGHRYVKRKFNVFG